MRQSQTIKDKHLAILRTLREDMREKAKRTADRWRKEDQAELKWELEMLGVKPLKHRR